MSSFRDFVPDQQFDYDVTPEEAFQQNFFDLVDEEPGDQQPASETVPDQPGAGDTFQGSDPTVFDEQLEWTDEQSADRPAGDQVGSDDDPEAQEQVSDEAAGQDESDTPFPEQIDAGREVDSTDEVRYPEQGQDRDEVTNKEPEQTPQVLEDLVTTERDWHPGHVRYILNNESIETAIDMLGMNAVLSAIEDETRQWANSRRRFERFVFEQNDLDVALDIIGEDAVLHQMDRDLRRWKRVGDRFDDWVLDQQLDAVMDAMSNTELNEIDEENGTELDNDDPTDFFTTPALLADFGDVISGLEQETFLTEFQFLEQDDI